MRDMPNRTSFVEAGYPRPVSGRGPSHDQTTFKFIHNNDYERLFFGKPKKSGLDVHEEGRDAIVITKTVRSRQRKSPLKSSYVKAAVDNDLKIFGDADRGISPDIDILDELFAKLQGLQDDKNEDEVNEEFDTETRMKRDRRQISTALIRLLSERLNSGLLESQEGQTGDYTSKTSLDRKEDLLRLHCDTVFRSHQRHPVSMLKMASTKGVRDRSYAPLHSQCTQRKNKSKVQSPNQDASLCWTYNVSRSAPEAASCQSNFDAMDLKRALNLSCINDLNLRKLLEELYKEYTFMGKIIRTTETDITELEVRDKLQQGRAYLLQRALFWLERSSQKDTPDGSSLASKIHRQQDTITSARNSGPQDSESSSFK